PFDFMGDDAVDGVVLVLVLEHIRDEEHVFAEAARVTRPGGVLAIAINHPVWTAPGSTPIQDSTGEITWRPAAHFSTGRAGGRRHHPLPPPDHVPAAELCGRRRMGARGAGGGGSDRSPDRPHPRLAGTGAHPPAAGRPVATGHVTPAGPGIGSPRSARFGRRR